MFFENMLYLFFQKCTKVFKGNTEPTFLKTYQVGEAFGELALLYNAPRAATITANEDSDLWKLDRDTFTYIVKDASIKKRQKYEELLNKVEMLSTMETYEKQQLSDAFTEHRFENGDYIITEGKDGVELFFLQEGTAAAMKNQDGAAAVEVKAYKAGDYFGERALMLNEPRACNVVATSSCVAVSMDRHSVKRLLGPLEAIMQRNMDMYANIASK